MLLSGKKKNTHIVREQSCTYPKAVSNGKGKQKQNEMSLPI